MPTIKKQSILFLSVANLTQIHLLICNLPVTNAFSVTLAVFIPAYILVPRLALDKGPLAMTLVIKPVAVVGVAGRVFHQTLAVAPAEDKVPFVNSAKVGDVLSTAVIESLFEFSAIRVAREGGFNCLETSKSLRGVAPRLGPEILHETFRISKQTSVVQFGSSAEVNIIEIRPTGRQSYLLVLCQPVTHNETSPVRNIDVKGLLS